MDNHANNGHGNSHDDHETEGNRQYYPKGWATPLIGLVTVALGFALLAGFVLRASGTDKWGATEQCDENGKCCNDPNCKGECKDDKNCKMKNDGNTESKNDLKSDAKDDADGKPVENK